MQVHHITLTSLPDDTYRVLALTGSQNRKLADDLFDCTHIFIHGTSLLSQSSLAVLETPNHVALCPAMCDTATQSVLRHHLCKVTAVTQLWKLLLGMLSGMISV